MKKCISCLLVLLMLLSFAGCGEEPATATVPTLLEPVGVKMDTATVEYGSIYNVDYLEGQVIPFVQTLYFDAAGTLGEVNVKVGDSVKAGDVLATLDQSDVEDAIAELDAEIAHEERLAGYSDAKAEADIAIAEAELEILRRDGGTSEELFVKWLKIEQLKTNLRQTKELRKLSMDELYAEREELKKQLGTESLVAPFDGEVVYVYKKAETGTKVDGSVALFVIADNSRTYIDVEKMSEAGINEAYQIKARVLDQEVELVYLPEVENPELEEVYSVTKGKLFGYVAEEPLRTGEFAGVLLITGYKENVLTVPVNAILRDREGSYVYKIEDGRRVRCNVVIGLSSDAKIEIVDGLKEGDVVYVQA